MASASPNTVLLRVISNTNGAFEFAVDMDSTVGETRALLEAQLLGETETHRIKLTFRGLVMEKDDQLWSSLAPKPNEAMYAVVTASRNVAPAGIPHGVGMPGMGLGGGLGTNTPSSASEQARMMEPLIDGMVSSPGFADMMISMSPELKAMVEKHPEMKEQLSNPELLKRVMRAQYDPLARREMDQAMNSQMAQLNNIPGGEAMLERLMGNMLQEDRYAPKTAADKKMATEENAMPKAGQAANTQEAPNPWARPQQQQQRPQPFPSDMGPTGFNPFGMGMGMGGAANPFMNPFFAGTMAGQPGSSASSSASAGSAPPPFNPFAGMFGMPLFPMQPPTSIPQPTQPAPTVANPSPPPPNYSEGMAALREMGFEDEAQMRRALAASKGDIDGAVAFIDAEQN